MHQTVRFEDLGLIPPLCAAVREEGYVAPTPIQQRAIPPVIAGRDLLGLAQTGTGKTAAFALPILQRLGAAPPPRGHRPTRALILTPTRELAAQIGESFTTYGRHLPLRNAVIFGGVGMEPQKQTLRAGVDVLVATPGRLLDLAGQGFVKMESLEVFVLDEADRMLDMGFIHDVRRVIALLPKKRQTLFFSATMPREAQELADLLLRDPETVAVTPPSTTVEKIDQEVLFVDKANKRALLVEALDDDNMRRVLVFTRTKHGANRVAEHLSKAGVHAEAIHGNKSQGARERALAAFKAGKMRVLVATDIAARGIDIDDITHVVNFDLPEVPETYVHRIGRTARAGASGFAMSFCDIEERELLHMIEKTTRQTIPVVTGHPYEPSWASQPYKPTGRPPMNLGKAEAREGREDRHPRDRGRGDHSRDPARSANAPRTGHPPASQTRDGHAHAGGHATHATHATHAAHGGHTAHGGGHAQAPRGGGAPRSGGGGGAPRPGGGNGGDGRGGRRRRGGRGGRGGGGGGGGGGPR